MLFILIIFLIANLPYQNRVSCNNMMNLNESNHKTFDRKFNIDRYNEVLKILILYRSSLANSKIINHSFKWKTNKKNG
jgi:hypothetical protein